MPSKRSFQDQQVLGSRVPPEARRALEKKKEFAEARGREFRVKQPRQTEPRALERQLQVEYRRYFNTLFGRVEELLLGRLESMLERDRVNLPVQDDLSDDIFIVLSGIRVQFSEQIPDFILRRMVQRMGLAVSGHNLRQFRKVFRRSLNVDPFASEPWLDSRISSFVEQNVGLIKSTQDRYLSEIQEIVFRGARQGLQTKDISQMIRERGRVTQSKADLIARDQINKFNGQLNQLRQQSVGVEKYRWRTSQDERVRPAHRAREGEIFSWDDPPSDGHPGEPIQCRCYAEPVLEELIEE